MIIYKITNQVNGKIYIGITTKPIGIRISSYKSSVKNLRNSRHRIVMAMKKHGFENFVFETIDYADSREGLKNKEIFYISQFSSCDVNVGYNVSPGGYLASEETLKKRSAKLLGRPLSKEHAKKISDAKIGKKRPLSVGIAVGRASKGRLPWNKGSIGIMKSNSGSFASGKAAPNKGRKKVIIDGNVKYVFPEGV